MMDHKASPRVVAHDSVDRAIAKRLIVDMVVEHTIYVSDRDDAGEALMKELVSIAHEVPSWNGYQSRGCYVLRVKGNKTGVWLRHDGNGSFSFSREAPGPAESEEARQQIHLHLNPETGLLEGTKIETERVPLPGGLVSRESGLAALLRPALAMLNEAISEIK